METKELKPAAWMRKWAFDKEQPVKERNENGRMAWPAKFKFMPVTQGKCFDDDVALVPAEQQKELLDALQMYMSAGFGNSTDFAKQKEAFNAARAAVSKSTGSK